MKAEFTDFMCIYNIIWGEKSNRQRNVYYCLKTVTKKRRETYIRVRTYSGDFNQKPGAWPTLYNNNFRVPRNPLYKQRVRTFCKNRTLQHRPIGDVFSGTKAGFSLRTRTRVQIIFGACGCISYPIQRGISNTEKPFFSFLYMEGAGGGLGEG